MDEEKKKIMEERKTWEKVKSIEIHDEDLHVETKDGRKLVLKEAKILGRKFTCNDDSLIIETPRIEYTRELLDEGRKKFLCNNCKKVSLEKDLLTVARGREAVLCGHCLGDVKEVWGGNGGKDG